jgi:hypothetical protein
MKTLVAAENSADSSTAQKWSDKPREIVCHEVEICKPREISIAQPSLNVDF